MQINLKKMKAFTAVTSSILLVGLAISAGTAWADVSVTAENGTTGANSENENTYEIDSEVEIEIESSAEVDNDLEIDVETGGNDVDQNTSVEDFTTGSIDGAIEVSNDLNTAEIVLSSADFGASDVDVDFKNHLTGSSSENENKVEIDQETEVSIENRADIKNDIDLDLSTGHNDVDHNTVVGDVTTGDIEIRGEVSNTANSGAGSLELPSMADRDVSVSLTNDTTGANSENENTVEIDSSLELEVENRADIDNDLDIDADTGNNDIGHNTVVGDITTGDISIDYTVTNTAN